MNKYNALKIIFEQENVYEKLAARKGKITYDALLNACSKDNYNLAKELNCVSQTLSTTLKYLWPDRTGNIKVCSYLFIKYDCAYCTLCKQVKAFDEFYGNSTKVNGHADYCKPCTVGYERDYQRIYQAQLRAKKLQRTPKWSETDKIEIFYLKCPKGFHVDHIYPLQGKTVCGLHVLDNLQYLSAEENIAKGNRILTQLD